MKKRLTIEISDEIHKDAKIKAIREGTTLTAKIIGFLLEWIRGD